LRQVERKVSKKKQKSDTEESGTEDEQETEEEASQQKTKTKSKKAKKQKQKSPRKKEGEEGYDPFGFDDEDDERQEGKSFVVVVASPQGYSPRISWKYTLVRKYRSHTSPYCSLNFKIALQVFEIESKT
jgi:hypothetical protein